jgi:hypothetical protein
VTDPTIAAARRILDDALEGMRAAVAATPPGRLNERPGSAETNPIPVLVTHALHSARSWIGVAVGGDLPPRDREAEFRVVADAPEALLTLIEDLGADCRAYLATEAPFEAGAIRVTQRLHADDDPDTESAAWALLHALEHLQEHVGHAQLTAQLLADRGTG